MVRAGKVTINPAAVATMEWDLHHINLTVTLLDGRVFRFRHGEAVEQAIIAAFNRRNSSVGEADPPPQAGGEIPHLGHVS